MDTQPSWWQVISHRIGLWLNPPDTRKPAEVQCPVCGYYCLGRGGNDCIDKPGMVHNVEVRGEE